MSRLAGGVAGGERFGWALFVAAVLHGVAILGISFSGPELDGPEEVPTLEVILLDSPVPGEAPPEDADYLAQANQRGAGNVTEQVQPELNTSPPAPQPPEDLERGLEMGFTTARPGGPAAEHIAARRSPATVTATPRPLEQEARVAEQPPEGGESRVTTTAEREHFVSVTTRESVFAEYLAAWKARMERLGTVNFPTVARAGQSGNPVVEVALEADGRLREVRVTRSSGHGALDQAALDLVRLASPYDPFPAPIRASYDVLRFAYEWRFIEGRPAGSQLRAPAPP